MPTEDWIQESLARLESLEEERNRHEAALETATDPATLRMNAQAIERLDAKIRSLYAELEAAAEQGDNGEEEQDERQDEEEDEQDDHDDQHSETGEGATRLFRRDDVAAQAAAVHAVAAQAAAAPAPAARPAAVATMPQPAPTPAPASPMASPFGGAVAPFTTGPASPFGEVAAPFPSSEQATFSTSSSNYGGSSYDDEATGGGSKMGLIVAGIVLVLGIGGYFAFKGKPDEPPPAAPTGPATVIRAGEIPPDTQGPKAVKGSNVDAIKGTQFKEGRPVPSGNSGGGNNPTPTEKPKKKDPRAKIQDADDPLAGIDK